MKKWIEGKWPKPPKWRCMSFQSLSILSVNCQTRDPTRTGVHPAHEAHGARGSIITGCLQPGASSEHQPPTPVLELCAAELMALWSEPDSSGEKALSEDQEAVIQGRGRQGAGSGVLRSWGESSRFLQSWRRPVSPAVTCGEPQPPPEGAAFLLLLLHEAGPIPSGGAWRTQLPIPAPAPRPRTHGQPGHTRPV